MWDEEKAFLGKEDWDEIDKFMEDSHEEMNAGWWKLSYEVRYLPSKDFHQCVDDKEITYLPKAYLDIVNACCELAIFLSGKENNAKNIIRTVDAYFYHKLSMSLNAPK